MAHEEFDLSELLDPVRAGGDVDVIRHGVEIVLQAIDAEAADKIGVVRYESSEARTNQLRRSPPGTHAIC